MKSILYILIVCNTFFNITLAEHTIPLKGKFIVDLDKTISHLKTNWKHIKISENLKSNFKKNIHQWDNEKLTIQYDGSSPKIYSYSDFKILSETQIQINEKESVILISENEYYLETRINEKNMREYFTRKKKQKH